MQVYGKKSSSRCWVEKHVPLHGGKFAFTCIVEGCKLRFSSQVRELSATYYGIPTCIVEGCKLRFSLQVRELSAIYYGIPYPPAFSKDASCALANG